MDLVQTIPTKRPSLRALRANSAAPWRVSNPMGTVKGLVPDRPRFLDQAVGWITLKKNDDHKQGSHQNGWMFAANC